MPPRITPFEPPYSEELGTLLARWMPPGINVEPLRLFRTLAHHRNMMDRMLPLGAGILGKGSIAAAEREIVINRTCARCGCEYEWGVHVASFGRTLNIAPEKLAATFSGTANDAVWTERERLLIRLVDELHDTSTVSDALWAALSQQWDDAQLIELCIIVGFYHLISFVSRAAQVEAETWAARFPVVSA
ncbi:MAG: carboxymuconolactone decarboxylase family protein [Anaerolineae bacterium]